jgi:hypothetical protein
MASRDLWIPRSNEGLGIHLTRGSAPRGGAWFQEFGFGLELRGYSSRAGPLQQNRGVTAVGLVWNN